MPRIVVTYPPQYDGELWIEATGASRALTGPGKWRFEFEHVDCGSDWATLVAAATAIIKQDIRASGGRTRKIVG